MCPYGGVHVALVDRRIFSAALKTEELLKNAAAMNRKEEGLVVFSETLAHFRSALTTP